jgi:GT2 family glycosyltransferase
LNEGEYLQRTVQSLMAGLPDDGEILVVDDGSTDRSADFLERTDERITLLRPGGRLGSPRARNFGARHARGKILVFSDAHVATPPAWATQLRAALNNPDVGAVMPAIRVMRFPDDYETVPASDNGEARGYGLAWSDAGLGVRWLARKTENAYPVPLLGAGFMAMRRTVFAAVGGFDPGLDLWGSEDAELSVRLWTLGYECLVLPGLEVAHLFRRDRPYHVDWEAVLCN